MLCFIAQDFKNGMGSKLELTSTWFKVVDV